MVFVVGADVILKEGELVYLVDADLVFLDE